MKEFQKSRALFSVRDTCSQNELFSNSCQTTRKDVVTRLRNVTLDPVTGPRSLNFFQKVFCDFPAAAAGLLVVSQALLNLLC